jgi:GDP/UDP-N,N'-diacetylbacillosamine 2-epimerase (hydrolysing)
VALAGAQMRDTIEACLETGLPILCFYPNSDIGYRDIITVMESYAGNERLHFIRFVERRDYLTMLAKAVMLVGNTSSGILEAPSFRTPVVNIGERQRGRTRASNIIDVPHDRASIAKAIFRALNDPKFREACAGAINPYGDGRSSRRICDILRDVALDERLLDKQTVY